MRDRGPSVPSAGLFLVLTLLLAACAKAPKGPGELPSAPEGGVVSPEILVDQPTIPLDDEFEFAAIAPDEQELSRQWQRFRLEGAPPRIDFVNQVMLLVGFGESGSCPYLYDGVEVDPDAYRLTFIDKGAYSGCTGDYNARTIGIAVNRSDLPDGVFEVQHPNGGAIPVAARHVATPPEQSAFTRWTSISDVFVALSPRRATTIGQVQVGLRNESHSKVGTPMKVRLDRWTGLGFEPADPPIVRGKNGGRGRSGWLSVRPGETKSVLTIDTLNHGLEASWYRVTVDLSVTVGGRMLVRGNFEVA